VEPDLFARFETDDLAPAFTPERRDRDWVFRGLRCVCGANVFRLTGWPRVISGRGGFFWRSVARVWREARLPMEDGEPVASPFWIPLDARCERCGRAESLLDSDRIAGRLALDERSEPRESVRCRICHESRFEIVVGVASDPTQEEPFGSVIAIEVVSRCHRCHRRARVAWSDGRRSQQEIRLDLLYGRR